MDEDDVIYEYSHNNIDESIDIIAQRIKVVTYGKTLTHIRKHYLEDWVKDYEINLRWFNMKSYIRKETGHDVALSSVATQTIGLSAEILRLPDYYSIESSEVMDKLKQRVKYLKQIWEKGLNDGLIYYSVRGEAKTLQVEFDEWYESPD
jgi:hypothetical protein